MTKLEEDLHKAIFSTPVDNSIASAAAEVAKRYIEKAYFDGYYAVADVSPEEAELPVRVLLKKWFTENGIV